MSNLPPANSAGEPPQAAQSAGSVDYTKYAERMQHPTSKETPAMKIAILVTVGSVLVVAFAVFFGLGGMRLFAGPPAPLVPTATVVPAQDPERNILQPGGVTR
ncbi:MAG: hypothetical protein HY534_05490 [Chloroflexi bacterium]|nr:hypothetical protein [Chloroflexota bacterium]